VAPGWHHAASPQPRTGQDSSVTEFKVPELGENVTTGDILRVLVNVGDTIAKDQPVVELETDKATVEVPSSVAGVVKDIRVKQGDKVKVGDTILSVDENGAGASKPAAGDASRPESAPAAPPVAEAAGSESVEAARALRPERAAGPKSDQKVVSMPRPGRPEPVAARAAETPKPSPSAAAPRPERGPAAPAAPGVRRLAREIGVDVDEVQGTGVGGRITEEDVKEHAQRIVTGVGTTRGPVERRGAPLPDFQKWGPVERQPMSNIRRTTAQRLSYAWSTIPHVTQFDKADITEMEELRRKYREQVRQAGGDLTVTAMLVKVLAVAVKRFPQFNASIDSEADEIIYKKYVNVGVAVDTDRGLLVPVIRNADQKNLTQIAIELHQLAQKARDRKLTLEEMSGGGITISNLGGIGGTYFTPIINWPEVAILGVSRGIIEPVWRGAATPVPQGGSNRIEAAKGAFEPRQLLPLSLSYDHRVIDGADAMRFLRWVAEAVEQPFLLSLLG
jgi:pyruvate dehydrogenase E2 component (dihydrolipoyllysine-residue acetyltransferase)